MAKDNHFALNKDHVLAAEIPVGSMVMAKDAVFVRVREPFTPEARLVCVDARSLPSHEVAHG